MQLATLFMSFDGRIGRGKFWLGTVVILVATFLAGALLIVLGLGDVTRETGTIQIDGGGAANAFERTELVLKPWPSFILSVAFALPAAAVGVKRRKDRGFSGADVLGFLATSLLAQLLAVVGLTGSLMVALNVALLVWGICLLVLTGLLRGTVGPNKYGPDPLSAGLSRTAAPSAQ